MPSPLSKKLLKTTSANGLASAGKWLFLFILIGLILLVKDIATSRILSTSPSEDLRTVMHKFTEKNLDQIPVVRDDDPGELIGMLTRRDVIALYNKRVQKLKGSSVNLGVDSLH
ncbi:MAG: CBS domain-containing protein [Desulfovibrionales bacterium]